MPVRRPYRREGMSVGKLRALQQQAIFVGRIFTLVSGEIEQAKVEWANGMRPGRAPCSVLEIVPLEDDHFEAACQGPEDFEYRDVERQTRHRQPRGIRAGSETHIHPAEKVQYVPVFDHHALWMTCGSGGVTYVSSVLRRDAAGEIFGAFLPNLRPILVDPYRVRPMRRQRRRKALLRSDHRHIAAHER